MSNCISFTGRLAADAELKTVGSNTVLEFRVANNTGFGEREVTNWFRATLWGKRGESIEKMMRKGKQVFITGELSLRPWTTREGVERLSADVNVQACDFIGKKEDTETSTTEDAPGYDAKPAKKEEGSEDLPF